RRAVGGLGEKTLTHPFDQVRDPIDPSFQKGDFEPGKTIQDPTTQKRVETHHYGQGKAQNMGAVAVSEGTLESRMAPAGVHAHWKTESLGLSPDRIEILVAQEHLPNGSVDR